MLISSLKAQTKNLLRVYFAIELQEAKRNIHKKHPALGASAAFESFDSNNNVFT